MFPKRFLEDFIHIIMLFQYVMLSVDKICGYVDNLCGQIVSDEIPPSSDPF